MFWPVDTIFLSGRSGLLVLPHAQFRTQICQYLLHGFFYNYLFFIGLSVSYMDDKVSKKMKGNPELPLKINFYRSIKSITSMITFQ